MADTITVKQLANQAGIEARTLRRILRSQFPRETKGRAWEWQPDDPQIELILKTVKNNHKANSKTPMKAQSKNTKTKKPTKVTLAKKNASKSATTTETNSEGGK